MFQTKTLTWNTAAGPAVYRFISTDSASEPVPSVHYRSSPFWPVIFISFVSAVVGELGKNYPILNSKLETVALCVCGSV